MAAIDEKLLKSVRDYAEKNEHKERYEHSLRVADTARILCRKFNLDEDKGYFAGLSHDICKNMDKDRLYELVKSHNLEITEQEVKQKGLLHGKGAAIILKENFNYDDKDVLEAVSYHTTGKADLCPLGRCLFIADRMEPGRTYLSREYRDSVDKLGLNHACLKLLEDNMQYLEQSGLEIAGVSFEYERFLQNEINGGNL